MKLNELYDKVERRKKLQKDLDLTIKILGIINLTDENNRHLYLTIQTHNDRKTELYLNNDEVKLMLSSKMERLETEIELLDIELSIE